MNNLINKRRLGQQKSSQYNEIVSHLIASRNIVKLQRYIVKEEQEISNHYYGQLAIDSSGQFLLLGASTNNPRFHCFLRTINIRSKERKFHQFLPTHTLSLRRVQWSPSGNKFYCATVDEGLRLIDTERQVVCTEWNLGKPRPQDELEYGDVDNGHTCWSDWHPREANLFASCNERQLNVIDVRSWRWNVNPGEDYDEFNPTCCVWSNKNDNHLVVAERHGHIYTFDRRNILEPVNERTTVMNCNLDDELQMDELRMNGQHLFGHSRWENKLYQWRLNESDGKYELVRRYSAYPCIHGSRCTRCLERNLGRRCQYHLTDRHLFVPQGGPKRVGGGKAIVKLANIAIVFDTETGKSVNTIKSDDAKVHHSDDENHSGNPFYVLNNNHREDHMDVVVGAPDQYGGHLLYTLKETLKRSFEIESWSYGSPKDTNFWYSGLNYHPQSPLVHSIELSEGVSIH